MPTHCWARVSDPARLATVRSPEAPETYRSGNRRGRRPAPNETVNPKSQMPNHKQAPSTNVPMSFGAWFLFGFWSLRFEISVGDGPTLVREWRSDKLEGCRSVPVAEQSTGNSLDTSSEEPHRAFLSQLSAPFA